MLLHFASRGREGLKPPDVFVDARAVKGACSSESGRHRDAKRLEDSLRQRTVRGAEPACHEVGQVLGARVLFQEGITHNVCPDVATAT